MGRNLGEDIESIEHGVVASGADEWHLGGAAPGPAGETDVVGVNVLDHLVDGVRSHLPIGGELAAGDGDEPCLRATYPVHPRQVGRAAVTAGCDQRAESCPAAGHVGRGQLALDGSVDGGQQVVDVLWCALGVIEGAAVVGVGRSDVGEPSVGHHEHRAPVAGYRNHHGHLVADLVPGDGDVDALCRTDGLRVDPFVLGTDVVAPDPCGVDHRTGADRELLIGTGPMGAHGHPVDPALVVLGEAHRRRAVRGHCPVGERSGSEHAQDQSRVVSGGVVVEVGRDEPLGGQGRHVRQGLVAVQPLVELAYPPPAGQVVAPHGCTQQPGDLRWQDATLAEHRDQERNDLHEVRSVAQEPPTLPQCLVDEVYLTLLQVAQAAVDQLGGLRGGAFGKVSGLHECHLHAAGCGIEQHSCTGDTSTHHHEIELLVSHGLQGS